MDDPKGYKAARGSEAFAAFRQICRVRYDFDPVSDGALEAVNLLAGGKDGWKAVWKRFEESPSRYPNLPGLLDKASGPPQGSLFENTSPYRPADNRAEEESLREAMLDLASETAPAARSRIRELEERHGKRRGWVWSDLGQSPLACALSPLMGLCRWTEEMPAGDTPREIADKYAEWGWKADDAALRSPADVDKEKDAAAVRVAVRSVYADWLEKLALRFQKAVRESAYEVPEGIGGRSMPCSSWTAFAMIWRFASRRCSNGLEPRRMPTGGFPLCRA